MAQNSKYGYSTIGVQTNPEQPVQTNTPIAKIDGDITKTSEMVRNTSIQNIYNNASTIVDGNTTVEGDQNTELSPKYSVFAFLGVLGAISTSSVASGIYKHIISQGGCELPSFSIEEKIGGCVGGNQDPTGQNTMVRRSFGCKYNSIALAVAEGILTLQNNIIAYGQFDVAFMNRDGAVITAPRSGTVYGFKNGQIKGLVVGDVVRAYSRVTGDYAEHTVAYLDYDNDLVGFATTLPDWATVANKTKIELVQKAIAYGTPQLFGLKNVKIKVGDTIAEARTGEEMDVNTLTLNIANNIESNSGTKYNTSKETGGDYTFDVEMLFTNLKNRDIFRNKEEQALIITIDNGNVINASDPTQTYKIEIEIYRFVYETQEIPTASGGLLTESATGLCMHSFDEGSTMKITVRNDKPAATYQPA